MALKINENTYNAIMFNAIRTLKREDWLLEADELSETTGAPISEIVEGHFQPFCDRLIAASTFDKTPENIAKARKMFFVKFTELVA